MGYNAVSFRDLADGLGIKSASVHYHFRQKEDLGLALVERYRLGFFEALEGRCGSGDTPQQKVSALIETYRSALQDADTICLCGMLGAESSGLPQPLASAVAGFFRANIDWLEKVLPADWPADKRTRNAVRIVATLQGAMMLANSLKQPDLFDKASKSLLADGSLD